MALPIENIRVTQFSSTSTEETQEDSLALIGSLQSRIQQLERDLTQERVARHTAAQQQEDVLFVESQQRESLSLQLTASNQQLETLQALLTQKESHLQNLQLEAAESTQQINSALAEITYLTNQLAREKEIHQFLKTQLEKAKDKIIRLQGLVRRLQQEQKEIASVRQEPEPNNPIASLFRKIADVTADMIWTGIHGFPSHMFTKR